MRAAVRSVLFSAIQGIDLDFVRGRYALNSGYRSDFLGLPGATYTRAGAATAETAAGAIINFAANVPRITDRGVLIEEARTNLSLRSAEFGDATWSRTGATISADATAAPDGTTTADKLVEDSSTGTHRVLNNAALAVTAASTYTWSVFAKAAERTSVRVENNSLLGATFDLSNGAISNISGGITASVVALANGWYRLAITGAAGTTSERVVVNLVLAGSTSYTGNGTSGAFIWGAQLEAGATPSSYIPTGAASATRAADAVDAVVGFQPPAVFVQARVNNLTGSTRTFDLHNGTNNERITVTVDIAGTVSGSVTVGGSLTTIGSVASAVTAGTTFKAAVRRSAAGTWRLFVNGVAIGSESAVIAQPAATLLAVGRLQGSAEYLMGTVERLVAFPAIPTDAQLVALTAL